MNCEDFESNVNDLAREQIMEAGVRAGALAHRDECAACAQRLEEESALSFMLGALASDTIAVQPPPLGSNVLLALRSNQLAVSGPMAGHWRYVAAAGVSLAAIFLIVIAVAVIRSRSVPSATVSSRPTPGIEESVSPGATPILPTPIAGSDEKTPPNRKVKTKRVNLNPHNLAKESVASHPNKDEETTATAEIITTDSAIEITTEFMPVGYASPANMEDGGQLVRVELPRSALVAFGLPMNVNRYDEKVKADVFFGLDGMARAIRFVQ